MRTIAFGQTGTVQWAAVCMRCSARKHPTDAVDDGWKLFLPGPRTRTFNSSTVDALCWRCEREQRAAQTSTGTEQRLGKRA